MTANVVMRKRQYAPKIATCEECGHSKVLAHATELEMPYCGSCGKSIDNAGYTFCGWCGCQLDWGTFLHLDNIRAIGTKIAERNDGGLRRLDDGIIIGLG